MARATGRPPTTEEEEGEGVQFKFLGIECNEISIWNEGPALKVDWERGLRMWSG